jgi:hypothetical protein
MTEVYLSLPPRRSEIVYADSCSVAPASLNALTELMWAPGFKAASNSGPIDAAITPTDPAFFAGRSAFWNQKISRGVMDAAIQALVDKAVSETLERAAKRVETLAGNIPYEKAWKRAAKEIRAFKPI